MVTRNLLELLYIFFLLSQISLMRYIFWASLSVLLYQHIMWLFFAYFAIFVEPWLSLYSSFIILSSLLESQVLIGQIISILIVPLLISAFFLDHLLFLGVGSIMVLLPDLVLRLSISNGWHLHGAKMVVWSFVWYECFDSTSCPPILW